jgi:hypothetical protein
MTFRDTHYSTGYFQNFLFFYYGKSFSIVFSNRHYFLSGIPENLFANIIALQQSAA